MSNTRMPLANQQPTDITGESDTGDDMSYLLLPPEETFSEFVTPPQDPNLKQEIKAAGREMTASMGRLTSLLSQYAVQKARAIASATKRFAIKASKPMALAAGTVIAVYAITTFGPAALDTTTTAAVYTGETALAHPQASMAALAVAAVGSVATAYAAIPVVRTTINNGMNAVMAATMGVGSALKQSFTQAFKNAGRALVDSYRKGAAMYASKNNNSDYAYAVRVRRSRRDQVTQRKLAALQTPQAQAVTLVEKLSAIADAYRTAKKTNALHAAQKKQEKAQTLAEGTVALGDKKAAIQQMTALRRQQNPIKGGLLGAVVEGAIKTEARAQGLSVTAQRLGNRMDRATTHLGANTVQTFRDVGVVVSRVKATAKAMRQTASTATKTTARYARLKTANVTQKIARSAAIGCVQTKNFAAAAAVTTIRTPFATMKAALTGAIQGLQQGWKQGWNAFRYTKAAPAPV